MHGSSNLKHVVHPSMPKLVIQGKILEWHEHTVYDWRLINTSSVYPQGKNWFVYDQRSNSPRPLNLEEYANEYYRQGEVQTPSAEEIPLVSKSKGSWVYQLFCKLVYRWRFIPKSFLIFHFSILHFTTHDGDHSSRRWFSIVETIKYSNVPNVVKCIQSPDILKIMKCVGHYHASETILGASCDSLRRGYDTCIDSFC